MLNDEILQLKSYDEQTGRELSNVFPITNLEAVKVDSDTNLKEKLTEIGKQIEQTNNSLGKIDKKVDGHIENHPQNNENITIDDAVTSKEKTWSSSKIDDVVLTNVGAIWQEINGGQMVINSTMDGFLREVTIVGNTVQNADNLSDIQHLGIWNEEKQGYEIEIIVSSSSSKDDLNYQEFRTTIILSCQLMKVGDIADRLYWDSSKGRYVIEKNICESIVTTVRDCWKTTIEGVSYAKLWQLNQHFCITNLKSQKRINSVIENMKYVHESNQMVNGLIKEEDFVSLGYTLDSAGAHKYIRDNIIKFYYATLQTPQLINTDIREEIKLPTFINNTYITVNGGIQGSIKAKAPVDGGKLIKVLQEENVELKTTNHMQDELINTTMLATDEVVMLLEPLLIDVFTNEQGSSRIINMYVNMVQRGLKDENEIPMRYREQVKTLLGN